MPGPAKTPSALARARGNPGKRRLNDAEPQPAPTTAEPPAYLVDDALAYWQAIVPELIRIGTFTVVDRDEVADALIAKAEGHRLLLEPPPEPVLPLGSNVPDPRKAALALLKYASGVLARYGVGASDRTRIHVAPPKPESKWARLVS